VLSGKLCVRMIRINVQYRTGLRYVWDECEGKNGSRYNNAFSPFSLCQILGNSIYLTMFYHFRYLMWCECNPSRVARHPSVTAEKQRKSVDHRISPRPRPCFSDLPKIYWPRSLRVVIIVAHTAFFFFEPLLALLFNICLAAIALLFWKAPVGRRRR